MNISGSKRNKKNLTNCCDNINISLASGITHLICCQALFQVKLRRLLLWKIWIGLFLCSVIPFTLLRRIREVQIKHCLWCRRGAGILHERTVTELLIRKKLAVSSHLCGTLVTLHLLCRCCRCIQVSGAIASSKKSTRRSGQICTRLCACLVVYYHWLRACTRCPWLTLVLAVLSLCVLCCSTARAWLASSVTVW